MRNGLITKNKMNIKKIKMLKNEIRILKYVEKKY